MNAELLDPPLIRFEDFEFDPARVTHALAAGRNAAGDGEGKTAKRVGVLPVRIRDQR